MSILLSTLTVAALSQPLTPERLEGLWCLVSTRTDGMVIGQQEQWRFAPDGVLVVGRDAAEEIEGAYTVNDNRIETSLALQLRVESLDQERMTAVRRDTIYEFARGACLDYDE